MTISTRLKFGIGNLSFHQHSRQIIITLIVSLGLFGHGNIIGWTSSALPSLAEDSTFQNLTIAQTSWVASLVPFGALVTTPFAGLGIDNFGRKSTLVISGAVQLLGWFFIICASHVSMIYMGRLLTGISVGALAMVVPVFVGEIADSEVRGSLSIIAQFTYTFGLVFSYIFGAFCSWKLLAFLSAFPSAVLLALSGFIPESQRYYISMGRIEEAFVVLSWLRKTKSDDEVKEEINIIKQNLDGLREFKANSNTNIFSRHIMLPLFSCCILMAIQQLSGANALQFFTVNIFQTAGAAINPYLCTVLVGLVNLGSNFALTLMVDQTGRRTLLLISCVTITIAHFILAIFFGVSSSGNGASMFGWIPILAMVVYFFAFAIGIGPLPSLMMSELLPNHLIGVASGVTVFTHYLLAFWVVFSFQALSEIFGTSVLFMFFGVVCFLGSIFIYFMIPETKLKTLEEIQMYYGKEIPLAKVPPDLQYQTFGNLGTSTT